MLETTIRVMQVSLRPGTVATPQTRAADALSRGSMIEAVKILEAAETEPPAEDNVMVVCQGNEASATFTVPLSEAPRVGDEFVATFTKRPSGLIPVE